MAFVEGQGLELLFTIVVHNSCLVLNTGNFLLRVVSGILPAIILRSVHTFSWFLKSNCSSDFSHAETGNGAKKRVVWRREFFLL